MWLWVKGGGSYGPELEFFEGWTAFEELCLEVSEMLGW